MLPPEHILNHLFRDKPLPLIMGILNITPDSFSDGNSYLEFDKAVDHAKLLIDQGTDLLDIGGESTRPGSQTVDPETEMKRVLPVIEAIRRFSDIRISIDTRKALVAKFAMEAGADIINDISALRYDPGMIELLAENPQIGVILMHMQGEPTTMQDKVHYADLFGDILAFLMDRISLCRDNNIDKSRIMLDPGIGFGKLLEHNLSLLANLIKLNDLNLPLVVGASRKRFINDIFPSEPNERVAGSLAAAQFCLEAGIEMVRVHDVKAHKQFIEVTKAIKLAQQQ